MDTKLGGVDLLYSIVQMPAGVPVGTLAIGKAGAINAALLAAAVLALGDDKLADRLADWRRRRADSLSETPTEGGAFVNGGPARYERTAPPGSTEPSTGTGRDVQRCKPRRQ